MYHEEEVINGVLCWRGTPDGEWQQYTTEALTIALTAERSRNEASEALRLEMEKLSGELNRIRAHIDGVLWPHCGMARGG